jgi:hypothetical protein
LQRSAPTFASFFSEILTDRINDHHCMLVLRTEPEQRTIFIGGWSLNFCWCSVIPLASISLFRGESRLASLLDALIQIVKPVN